LCEQFTELNTVLLVDVADGRARALFGRQGRAPGEFSFVSGVRLDDNANVLVGDAKNRRVMVGARVICGHSCSRL
jgi:hypothetical protein